MSAFAGPEIVNNGLVLCLDAGNTKSYPGSGTTWTDLVGSGNNGTLTNGPTFSSTNGGSVVFDGVNDYVEFGDVFDIGTNDLTVNVWARATAFTGGDGYYTLVSKSYAAGQPYRWAAYFNGSSLEIVFDGSGTSPVVTTTTSTFNTNTWYMFTIVFTRSSSITVYSNGIQQSLAGSSTISQWNGVNFQSANPLRVGTYTASNNISPVSLFSGNIASVQMYFRSLSLAEIRQNFNALRGRYGI